MLHETCKAIMAHRSVFISNKLCDIHHCKQWESINKVWRMPFIVQHYVLIRSTIVDEITFAYLRQFHFDFIGNSTTETFILVLWWNHSSSVSCCFLWNVRFGSWFLVSMAIPHRSHRSLMANNNLWNEQIWIGIFESEMDGEKLNALQTQS